MKVLLNESTKIMKFALNFLYILHFNQPIEKRSVYKANLINTKKMCMPNIIKLLQMVDLFFKIIMSS